MEFCEINPFIRFAETIYYCSENHRVQVKDCRLFYVLSGEAEIFIQNQQIKLLPYSLFYCCAQSQYCINSSGATLIALNFDLTQKFNHKTAPFFPVSIDKPAGSPSAFRSENKDFFHPFEPVADGDCLNSFFFIPNAYAYSDGLIEILTEFLTQRIHFRERCSGILKDILTQIYRRSVETSDNAADAVSKTIDYIKNNYAKTITNKMLSEMTGYHEYHLNRLFLKNAGTSIHQYLLSIRINAAKKMLINTSLPMSTIAEQAGFTSKTHFSSSFKRIVGIPPTEYRRRFKNTI